jgi:hypothetical protein
MMWGTVRFLQVRFYNSILLDDDHVISLEYNTNTSTELSYLVKMDANTGAIVTAVTISYHKCSNAVEYPTHDSTYLLWRTSDVPIQLVKLNKVDYSPAYNIQISHNIADGHHWTFEKITEGTGNMLLVDSTDDTSLSHHFVLVDFSGAAAGTTTFSNQYVLGPTSSISSNSNSRGYKYMDRPNSRVFYIIGLNYNVLFGTFSLNDLTIIDGLYSINSGSK